MCIYIYTHNMYVGIDVCVSGHMSVPVCEKVMKGQVFDKRCACTERRTSTRPDSKTAKTVLCGAGFPKKNMPQLNLWQRLLETDFNILELTTERYGKSSEAELQNTCLQRELRWD